KGIAAHSPACVGTEWTFEARGGDTPQNPIDERRHDRPLAPEAEAHGPYEKAESCARAAAAHQNAHLC
ncbi:hypothetical protein, partial [Mesorhizobium sp.]|uniref:hypothetical protein n=1 Tax=Mesorhizobium sp. TaxID=1871066 RepID=UPI0025D3666C